MQRALTWLVIAAVVGLAAAAGVDALQGEPGAAEPRIRTEERPPRPPPADLAADLREAGVTGVLTYADEECRVRALVLPDLQPHPAPTGGRCRLAAPALQRFGPPVGDPQRVLVARCRSGRVEVAELGGNIIDQGHGCEPAWGPNGALAVVRDGAIVELASRRVLLSKQDLARELRRAGWEEFSFAVERFAWLRGGAVALIADARSEGGGDVLAVFRGRRALEPPSFDYDDLTDLRSSPLGTFAAARIGGGGLAVLDRRGRPAELFVRHGQALAWSPDERWIAEATEDGIYIFESGDRVPTLIRIPVVAQDLVWR